MTLHSVGIVGTILGPIGTRQEGAVGTSGWTNTDVYYDYAIGGVPFMIRPSDEIPYTRATAQFRKQQFDSQATVGEQSLDGFWRRSQFSFHQGAGVEFFDAFTDDVTLRANEMEGVDPWTPGRVTLGPSYASDLTVGHTAFLNGYDGSSTSVAWYIKSSDSHLRKWDGATDTDVSSAAVTAFAVDPNPGGRAYYANSTTIKTSDSGTTVATLSAGSWKNIWWAKERLIAVDDLGGFYEIAPLVTAQTITQTTDSFWAGNGRYDLWTLADSPSAIFLSYGRTISKVVLDSTGAVPTLAGGITAAELPTDESISAMAYYLGFLVLVTSKGPRVATVDTDGNVTYGARIFDLASTTCTTIASSGSRVWFTGRRDDDSTPRVFTVDLSEPTTDGYGWAVENDFTMANGTHTGVIVFGDSVAPWDGSDLFVAGTANSRTGFLSTGYIRFGTMEPKAFHSVRIKLDGDGGSVTIVLVRKGGGETTLTNLQAANFTDRDVNLNLPRPEEYIGLKFVMVADATTGASPVLLGYQLKALPAPKRNRMIQVPLKCYDSEETSDGTMVNLGAAFDRVLALETMEESGGVIVVQDFRTDEQFSAFVEQVQFVNDTPPRRGVPNFGGTILVTLRKVSS